MRRSASFLALLSSTSVLALSTLAACGDSSSTSSDGSGGALQGSPGKMQVWTSGVGRKVQPTTAPETAASISVASARDAWASAQLIVRGKDGYLKAVGASVAADLDDGAGHTLAKSNVTLFRETFIDFTDVQANNGNVPAPAKSPTHDGKVPDALVPLVDPYTGKDAGQPFDVRQNENQPLFVDVHIPTGTPAGTYQGTLHVTDTAGDSADVPLSVTVWDLDLTDMRSVTTHFKLSSDQLTDYHANISKCSGGSCYLDANDPHALEILKRYEEMAHEHRIDVGPQFVPQAGPGGDCSVPTDWTAFDAGMQPYMDGSYYSDGIGSSFFDVPFSPGSDYGSGTCSDSELTAMGKAWAQHLKAKGWFDRSIAYASDEPDPCKTSPCDPVYQKIAEQAAALEAGDPDWRAQVMDTTSPSTLDLPILGSALGIYAVNLLIYGNYFDQGPYYGPKEWPKLFGQGIKLWFYASNSVVPPDPTFASNTLDGLEPVMMMWGSWYEKATGFLYYDVSNWDADDPWGPNIKFGLTGDGVLLYPGNHAGSASPKGSPSSVSIDGPVASYRLKMIRNGLQDWALFRMADDKGLTSMVEAQVAEVYQEFGQCTYDGCPPAPAFTWKTDEATMDSIRENVAKALVAAK